MGSCPSVCLARATNSETQGIEKPELVSTFLGASVNAVPIFTLGGQRSWVRNLGLHSAVVDEYA